jgi:hypothetical protein
LENDNTYSKRANALALVVIATGTAWPWRPLAGRSIATQLFLVVRPRLSEALERRDEDRENDACHAEKEHFSAGTCDHDICHDQR